MLAVLIAAQIAAAAPAVTTKVERLPGAEPTRETPNLYRTPERCRDVVRWVTRKLPPNYRSYGELQGSAPRNLGEMPPARAEYAVNRTVAGCPVPAPVGYRQDYLLPGAADAKPAGAR